ncbi:MAG TPA: hypothetical protein VKT52_12965 [Ktedonobacterales bacterium]|nr:hypothetical protein [Ktedonobacterales bacterium]
MALQECEALLIKLLNLLVDRSVGAAFEDHQLGTCNAGLQWLGKPGGRNQVVSAKRDLGGRLNAGEHRLGVVRQHCVSQTFIAISLMFAQFARQRGG